MAENDILSCHARGNRLTHANSLPVKVAGAPPLSSPRMLIGLVTSQPSEGDVVFEFYETDLLLISEVQLPSFRGNTVFSADLVLFQKM